MANRSFISTHLHLWISTLVSFLSILRLHCWLYTDFRRNTTDMHTYVCMYRKIFYFICVISQLFETAIYSRICTHTHISPLYVTHIAVQNDGPLKTIIVLLINLLMPQFPRVYVFNGHTHTHTHEVGKPPLQGRKYIFRKCYHMTDRLMWHWTLSGFANNKWLVRRVTR